MGYVWVLEAEAAFYRGAMWTPSPQEGHHEQNTRVVPTQRGIRLWGCFTLLVAHRVLGALGSVVTKPGERRGACLFPPYYISCLHMCKTASRGVAQARYAWGRWKVIYRCPAGRQRCCRQRCTPHPHAHSPIFSLHPHG